MTEIVKHSIKWWAIGTSMTGERYRIRRQSSMSMASNNFGWEATCSCGWETHTGGAVPSCVRDLIADHKFDVALAANFDDALAAKIEEGRMITRGW